MIAVLIAWPVLSVALALLIGRCIRLADAEQSPTRSDLGLAA